MKNGLILLVAAMSMFSCKMVKISVQNDTENINLMVPFSALKTALHFSDGNVVLDDFGGVDQEIDLVAIAKALRDNGDKIKFEIKEADTHIRAEKDGNVFRIKILESEDRTVQVNLPMALMDTIAAKADTGKLTTMDLVNGLKDYKGILVSVDSLEEKVKISM